MGCHIARTVDMRWISCVTPRCCKETTPAHLRLRELQQQDNLIWEVPARTGCTQLFGWSTKSSENGTKYSQSQPRTLVLHTLMVCGVMCVAVRTLVSVKVRKPKRSSNVSKRQRVTRH